MRRNGLIYKAGSFWRPSRTGTGTAHNILVDRNFQGISIIPRWEGEEEEEDHGELT